jgi:hypothetical protein
MSELKEGMLVKVVKVPPDEDYASTLGKCGTVEGEPWTDDHGIWAFVIIDGERVPCEFKAEELESVKTAKVLEGELQYGDGQFWVSIDGECLTSAVKEFAGKRVRVTIEQLD